MEWMFLPLRRYAQFSGRSRPIEFWMFCLLQLIVYILITVIAMVVGVGVAGLSSAGSQSAAASGMLGIFATLGVFALVYGIVYLAFFVPNLAVATRRLHDTGKSGLWQLIYWVPWIVGTAVSVMNLRAQMAGSGPSGLGMVFSGLQLIGLIVLIVFYCLPGHPGPNRYGPDPKAGEPDYGAAPATY